MTGAAAGRPLRFFALLMIGWTMMRLFSQPSAQPPVTAPVTVATVAVPTGLHTGLRPPMRTVAGLPPYTEPTARSWTMPIASRRDAALTGKAIMNTHPASATPDMPVDLLEFISFAMAFASRHFASDPFYNRSVTPPQPVPLLQLPAPLLSQPQPDRWHGSAWMLWRDGSTAVTDVASVGRLGGSQTGVRIDYDLTPDSNSRTTGYTRATAALQRPHSQEAAIGIAYQPARAVPISFAVERRVALGQGGRNATAILAVGGFGPTLVGQGIAAEGYAQAGMVGFNRRDRFIDGRLSLLKPIDGAPLRIGATLSGGAQPAVERLDIGPEMQLRLPLLNASARISVEWRERIMGRAAPASGLAITLAADF